MCVCDFIECLKFIVMIESCSNFLSLYRTVDVVISVTSINKHSLGNINVFTGHSLSLSWAKKEKERPMCHTFYRVN